MASPSPHGGLLPWLVGAGAVLVAALALYAAVSWYGHPIGGMLLTPDLEVSSVGMPSWDGLAKGLRYPDRVLTIDGNKLSADGRAGVREWYRAVDRASRRGNESVHVRVRLTGSGTEQELDLRVQRIDPVTWWLYGGGLIFTGGLYVVSGILALSASPRGNLARAFAKFACVSAVYLFGFFDTQTGRVLLPAFNLSFGWSPFLLVALALRLPDDLPFVRRFPVVFPALDFAGLALGGAMALGAARGEATSGLRIVATYALGLAPVFFLAVLVGRLVLVRGKTRDLLWFLFRAIAAPYAVVAAGVTASTLSSRSSTALFFALPMLALAPVATAVAFARNDLWGSRALLSRFLTRGISASLACLVAIGIGAALAASLGIPFRDALPAAAAGAIVSAPLVYLALVAIDRSLFPAVAHYKPTIEQLSEDLTGILAPGEIASAVERTVRRWLPCEGVEFASTPAPPADLASETNGAGHELVVPAMFRGRPLGFLRVGRKHGGALFTSEDVDLLRTIANQAALALAHARSYAELEQRRQQQAAAWQFERLALVETLAAEVAHEVRYPINFFRSVFRRVPGAATLTADEVDVGCEEVDRLDRLVSELRRLVGRRVERRTIPVGELAARVETLLRDALGLRRIAVQVPEGIALRCDPDQATQMLVNLVSNAIEAGGIQGRVGIEWRDAEAEGELVVWDDGAGFDGDVSRLFAPWYSTKPRGTGLGLAITQRIARAHNWTLNASRAEGITRFSILIPYVDVVSPVRRTIDAGAAPR
jgi:signal transduction histidine kinase